MDSDYQKYRGRCKEMSEQLVKENPQLKLVRGYYFDPIWNREEPHWWCVDEDGKIHDPSRKQFPSAGAGTYTEFTGTVECSNCGKSMKEDDAKYESNYVFCSGRCYGIFVGVF